MHLFFSKFHKGWIAFLFLVLTIFVWFLGQLHREGEPQPLAPLISASLECTTNSVGNERTFLIYSAGESNSTLLNTIACTDAIINKQFGTVLSYWGVSDQNSIGLLGNGKADLALVKENIMNALRAEETHGYRKVAYYPDYQTYFIALTEKPILSKEYFVDKKVGLLVYPTSRSGHIVPKKVLTSLGLSLDRMSISYASSHQELREMLVEGKVDIISSFWDDADEQQFSRNNITQISDSVSGTAWYLKMPTENVDLLCATQQFLSKLAEMQLTSYYKDLKLVESVDCASWQGEKS